MSIDFDEASEEMQDDTEFVPRVILSTSNGDGIVKREELDENTRRIETLIPMIENIMSVRQSDSESLPVISLSPMDHSESVGDKTKGKKKKSKSVKKEKGGKKSKGGKKKEQSGKGFVEAALATAILGGSANAANQSSTVKKYLKQAEDGIIGLSKASSDLAKGSLKILTEQDMMKKLANVTKSLSRKRRKTRKLSKRKSSRTRKRPKRARK
jgi:hypothetical protein